MNMLRALRSMVRDLGGPGGKRRHGSGRLTLEVLEARLCLSNNPYAYVSSYKNSSVMRYDELTGEPKPAPGKTGATLVSEGAGGLDSPLDVLLAPNGDLLVGSAEGQSIKRYDATTGDYLDDLIPGNGGLFFPTGFVFSPDYQSFYVANNGNNTIVRYDYDGAHATNPVTFISSSELGAPAALVFGPDGNIYIGSLNNSKVLRYDGQTGDPLPGPRKSGADFIPQGFGGLNRSGGVVFGPDGNLYVASQFTNSILRFNGISGQPLPADGQNGADFVAPGSCGLSDPAGIVFGPGPDSSYQDLYIVSINTSNVIKADGQTGACAEFIPDGSGGLSAPRDLIFGSTDPSSLNYVSGDPSTAQTRPVAVAAAGLIQGTTVQSSADALSDSQTPFQATLADVPVIDNPPVPAHGAMDQDVSMVLNAVSADGLAEVPLDRWLNAHDSSMP
jgi:DNA-binding beta-propeller fold protein YncE